MLLFNPISGSGRAAKAAGAVANELVAAGHEALLHPTRLDPCRTWLDPALAGVDLLVVAGGDGAMRIASASASRTGTPVYHLPCGTENLFAREFGMTLCSRTLLRAIESRNLRTIDMASANGRPFLLMASVGYDAEVVHDLAGRRGKSISRFSYLAPVLRQLRRWRPPVLDVTVDGERLDQGQTGFVVIANCKQYGWRLNPATRASMSDGLLDVAFFPTRSRFDLIRWAIRCRRQRQFDCRGFVYRTGRAATIRCHQPVCYQLDGDPPGECETPEPAGETAAPFELPIEVQPSAMKVLVPPIGD